MRRHLRSAAWGAIAASLGLAACKGGAQSEAGGALGESKPAEEPADVTLRKVAFVRLSEGRVAARGTAADAAWWVGTGKVAANRLLVELPPGSQAPADLGHLRIEAPRATGEIPARRGEGEGGVVATADRGDRGETARVLVDGFKNEVEAPGRVQIRGSGFTVDSASLTARADGTRVQFLGGVSGRLESSMAAPAKAPARKAPVRSRRKR